MSFDLASYKALIQAIDNSEKAKVYFMKGAIICGLIGIFFTPVLILAAISFAIYLYANNEVKNLNAKANQIHSTPEFQAAGGEGSELVEFLQSVVNRQN